MEVRLSSLVPTSVYRAVLEDDDVLVLLNDGPEIYERVVLRYIVDRGGPVTTDGNVVTKDGPVTILTKANRDVPLKSVVTAPYGVSTRTSLYFSLRPVWQWHAEKKRPFGAVSLNR